MTDDAQWRTMESAPRDRAVLLWWPEWWHNPVEGWYRDYQWHSDKALTSFPSGNDPEIYRGPLAWTDMPPPPQEVEP